MSLADEICAHPFQFTVHVPRNTRFPLRLSIRYRPAGMRRWLEGVTENISSTGVLVRATAPPAADSAVDLCFEVRLGRSRSQVACRGTVVRAASRFQGDNEFAATISKYRFVRPDGQ
jgi:hypothetical protein